MEILLISADKLKISLSKEDMESLSLQYQDMDYADGDTKKALIHLLEKGRAEVGFNPRKSKLFIEVYPSEHDGCVLYFTALRTTAGRAFASKTGLEPVLFEFDDADVLIDCACKVFERYSHRIYKSSLYRYQNKYRLIIYPLDYSDRLSIYFLSEFATKIGESELMAAFTEEHAQMIVQDNALDVLSDAFSESG